MRGIEACTGCSRFMVALAGRGGFCIFHVEDLETSTWRKLDAQMRDFKVWTSTVVWTSRVRSLRSQLADASVRELPDSLGGSGYPDERNRNFKSCDLI